MTEIADPHLDMDLPVIDPANARTLGEQLRLTREARGLTLADIALRTRVPERTLAAIEADAYDQLPHPTFAAGFVRSLAREVGLREDEATLRYRAENTRVPPTPTAPTLRPFEPERVPSRRLAWGSGIVVAVAIVGAVIWFGRDRRVSTPTPANIAATTMTTQTAVTVASMPPADQTVASPLSTSPLPLNQPAPTASTPTGALPPPTPAPAASPTALGAPGGTVTLTATQDVWIQVRDKASGKRLISNTLAQGKTYAVPPGNLALTTGRAGALQVRVNGRLLPPLGGLAETLRSVDLTPAALEARAPAPGAASPR